MPLIDEMNNHVHTDGTKRPKNTGRGTIDPNPNTYHTNPWVSIPSDVDQNPLRVLYNDFVLILSLFRLVPNIFLPLRPCRSGSLDELSLTLPNILDICLHAILIIMQFWVILMTPVIGVLFWFLPGAGGLIVAVVVMGMTLGVMRLLNGGATRRCLVGVPEGREVANDEKELWFFINGVATGRHWLQSNLTQLANIFQREIVGIHNPTKGLLFDLIECLIQRDLSFKTQDIRQGRAQIRAALLSPVTKKLVLIAHSQGAIEASAILDWLLADCPSAVFSKLEIYTFGSAANHFNNPVLTLSTPYPSPTTSPTLQSTPTPLATKRASFTSLLSGSSIPRSPSSSFALSQSQSQVQQNGTQENKRPRRSFHTVPYIEHYANTGDFVANFGVLQYTSGSAPVVNTGFGIGQGGGYSGLVFRRDGTGHLLNMHYLDRMFKMKRRHYGDGSVGGEHGADWEVDETGNQFMNSLIPGQEHINGEGSSGKYRNTIKDVSRLWGYINGREPLDLIKHKDIESSRVVVNGSAE